MDPMGTVGFLEEWINFGWFFGCILLVVCGYLVNELGGSPKGQEETLQLLVHCKLDSTDSNLV